MKCTPRVIDQELEDLLKAVPIVVVEGPKAVGKTFSATASGSAYQRKDGMLVLPIGTLRP
jgi:Rad3-related DNA helicase